MTSKAKPLLQSATGYGLDWESKVSPKRARALALMYPLPKPGYEITVAVAFDDWRCKHRLMLQNIYGDFYLASCSVPKAKWLDLFKVGA